MVSSHTPGPRTEGCCPVSPCERGSPWSPALFSSPAPQETAARPLWPPAPNRATSAPSLSPGDRSALPDPGWPSAFICIFLPLFPAGGQSARGARRGCWAGLGLRLRLRHPAAAAAGSRAGLSRCGRAAHCSPSPDPHPRPRCCPSSVRP